MAARTAIVVSRAVRELSQGEVAALSDRSLLQRFVEAADQAAFAALVARHSKMVLGVCKRGLPTDQDAEDACQAVFLILARKAPGTRWQASLGNWLYTTARKVARNVRRAAVRRAAREGRAARPESVAPADSMTGRELAAVLDEELDNLAPRYREPLVLCYLEGLTRDEAAARLGVPVATLKSQLERGRKKLADAITARGCTFGGALLATAAATTVGASVPKLNDTILAAVSGKPTETVAALVKREAMNGMLRKAKYALLALIGLGVVGFGAVGLGAVVRQPPEARPPAVDATPTADPASESAGNPAEEPGKPAAGASGRTFAGKVLGADGKPVPGAKIYYCFPDRGAAEIPAVPSRATTDPDGRFTFTLGERDIPNTAVAVGNDPMRGGFLVAKAPGHTWVWEQINAATGEVVLTCAADTVPVRGRIIDLQGQPIAGVRVTPLGVAAPAKGDFSAFLKAFERGEAVSGAVRRHLPNFWHDYSAIQRRPSPLLPATTTDAKGWFQLDGYAADRVVEVRLEGDAIETQDVYFVTGKPAPLPVPKPLTEADDPAGFFRREMVPQREPKVLKANGDSYAAAPGLVVTGVVRDAASGKPVAAAVVETYRLAGQRLVQNAIYHTLTDAEGRYRLGGLPVAHGSAVRVRNTGDVPLLPAVKDIPETKLFVPAALDVALDRGVWVEITTTDRATGKPVAGNVSYFVMPLDKKEPPGTGRDPLRIYDSRIPVPNDGRLRIAVIPDRPAVLAFSASSNLVSSRYPIAADAVKRQEALRGASPGLATQNYNAFADVNPKAGSDPVPVRLTLDSSRRVEGKLIGPDGKPVSGALASGLLHDWYTEPLMPLRGAEFAVLGAGAEHPRLICFSQPQSKLAGFVVVRGDEKEPLVVKLQPAASVRGRLVDDAGRPVKQARLGFVELPLARTGEYHSTETGVFLRDRLGSAGNVATTIKKDGTVVTTDLGPNAGAMAGMRMNTINADGSVTTTGRPDPEPVTDADGRFTVSGLIPGLKYHLVWKDARRPRPPATDDWKGIVFRDVVFKPGEGKDVGEVKSEPLPAEKK